MPYYKAIFHLPGGNELKAHRGHVPDAFFEAIQKTPVTEIIDTYQDGFVLSTAMHQKLSIPDTFASYAITGLNGPEGSDKSPEFRQQLLDHLKEANHARPIEEHYNYQVFVMEIIDDSFDDD